VLLLATFNPDHHALSGFPERYCLGRDEIDAAGVGLATEVFEELVEPGSRRYGWVHRLVG
jgi:hypothetical protein